MLVLVKRRASIRRDDLYFVVAALGFLTPIYSNTAFFCFVFLFAIVILNLTFPSRSASLLLVSPLRFFLSIEYVCFFCLVLCMYVLYAINFNAVHFPFLSFIVSCCSLPYITVRKSSHSHFVFFFFY